MSPSSERHAEAWEVDKGRAAEASVRRLAELSRRHHLLQVAAFTSVKASVLT